MKQEKVKQKILKMIFSISKTCFYKIFIFEIYL